MSSLRTRRQLAAAATAALATLALTACANPIEQLVQRGAESAVENLIQQGTDGKVDISTDGDGGMTIDTDEGSINFGAAASVPADWPGLPLPDGQLTTSFSASGGFMLTYEVTEAEVEKLVAALEQAGFVSDSTVDLGELKTMMYERDDYGVVLGWIIDEDEDLQQLQYQVHARG